MKKKQKKIMVKQKEYKFINAYSEGKRVFVWIHCQLCKGSGKFVKNIFNYKGTRTAYKPCDCLLLIDLNINWIKINC
jgi:hypothetical protein